MVLLFSFSQEIYQNKSRNVIKTKSFSTVPVVERRTIVRLTVDSIGFTEIEINMCRLMK